MTRHLTPPVFVIVLSYKRRELTDRCIQALLKQSYPEFRVVVVDNGSQDGSAEYLAARHPEIHLVRNPTNLGFAGGVNSALRQIAAGNPSYVWLLNNDATPEPDALAELVRTAEADPEIAAAGSVVLEPPDVRVWGGGRVSFFSGLARHHHAPVNAGQLDYLTGASLLLRWNALEQNGFLDERFFFYWEDADLCFRLRASGWKLAVSAGSRIHHDRSSSIRFQSALWDFHFTASSIRFFRRHSRHPMVPILISTTGRFVRRCLQRRWTHARAVKDAFFGREFRTEAGADA